MNIDPDIVECLRFNDDDTVLCKGGEFERFECGAIAIHFWNGDPRCAVHSPVDNVFVPCTRCGEKPAYRGESVEVDPVCPPCASALTNHGPEKPATVDPTDPSYAPFGSAGEPETPGQICRRMSGADEYVCPDHRD